MIRDLTGRKNAELNDPPEQSPRKPADPGERRARLALLSSDIGTWEYYPGIGILHWDARCKGFFGLSANASIDYQAFLDLLSREDRGRVDRIGKNALRGENGGLYSAEYRLRETDGNPGERWLLAQGRVYFDRNGHADRVVGTVRDISKRKRTELDLEGALRARDELLTIATHELKTPITAMQLRFEMLERVAKKNETLSTEQVLSALAPAKVQIARLDQLINNLLDMSRLSGNQGLCIDLTDFDLSELARDVCTGFQTLAITASSPIFVRASAPVNGRWDRLRLGQVITNLVSNSLKYGARHPIELSVETDGRFATLTVSDHGGGIRAEDRQRIFRRFERASNECSSISMGLGLYIVREIVNAHGGNVRVESELGKGASFIVTLPLVTPGICSQVAGSQ